MGRSASCIPLGISKLWRTRSRCWRILPRLREQLGARGRQRAEANFTADRIVPEYEALYRRSASLVFACRAMLRVRACFSRRFVEPTRYARFLPRNRSSFPHSLGEASGARSQSPRSRSAISSWDWMRGVRSSRRGTLRSGPGRPSTLVWVQAEERKNRWREIDVAARRFVVPAAAKIRPARDQGVVHVESAQAGMRALAEVSSDVGGDLAECSEFVRAIVPTRGDDHVRRVRVSDVRAGRG